MKFNVGDSVQFTEDACQYYGNDCEYVREWGLSESDLAFGVFEVLAVNEEDSHDIPYYSLQSDTGQRIGSWEFDLQPTP